MFMCFIDSNSDISGMYVNWIAIRPYFFCE
jgi:hypothetical protein